VITFSKWDRRINAALRTFDAELTAAWRGSGRPVDAMKRFLHEHVVATVAEFKRLGLPEPSKTMQLSIAEPFVEELRQFCAKVERSDADRQAVFDAAELARNLLMGAAAMREEESGVPT
jgi:hypothetical protein